MSHVWADELPLYIWSGEATADLAPVKTAKLALEISETVRPVGLNKLGRNADDIGIPWEARVLAIGSRPPFICNYALTSEKTSPEGWQRALLWVLGKVEFDPKATTIEDIVISVFPGAREIPEAELEAERKLQAYIERSD